MAIAASPRAQTFADIRHIVVHDRLIARNGCDFPVDNPVARAPGAGDMT